MAMRDESIVATATKRDRAESRDGGSEVILRSYRPADLATMTEIDAACFATEFLFGATLMQLLAETAYALSLIAETQAGEMLGFVIAHCSQESAPGVAYLVTLDVLPKSRQQGLGGALLAEAERLICEGGAQRMDLHVHTGNRNAIRFYEQHGYVVQSRVRDFYGCGRGDRDAFLYSKPIDQAPQAK